MNVLLKLSNLFILLLFISLFSCAQHIVPKPQIVDESRVLRFEVNESIIIVNNQPSKEDKSLYGGSMLIKGNWNEWTEKAVKLLKSELTKRGRTTNSPSKKMIKLAIENIELEAGAVLFSCELNLIVETGSGYKADYFVRNRTPHSLVRAGGGAITLAIIKMLNDKEIISYLQ